jgi:hypothetical protein
MSKATEFNTRVREELAPREDNKRFDVVTIGWMLFMASMIWLFTHDLWWIFGPIRFRYIVIATLVLYVFRKEIWQRVSSRLPKRNPNQLFDENQRGPSPPL